ncbi:MAG: PfkB family carbohydrate kinase, partial [Myxococcota bacterium]|nr:PfkB family carbohydrate kinase [Myxococcota bacterium]
ITTVYDPALHRGVWPEGSSGAARGAFDALVPLTDVLVISAPFATGQLLQRASAAEAADVAQRRGLSRVIVRHGRRGCVVVDHDEVREITVPTEAAVRTSPLGEAVFNGAVCAALMRGQRLEDAAHAALRCTDLLVDGPDTLANIPASRLLLAAMDGQDAEVPPAP